MTERRRAPYGTWESPISAELVARSGVSLADAQASGGNVAWLEGRPLEGGRSVVVLRRPGAEPEDLTPAGFNARTRVHEYGGGAYLLHGDTVFFANFADQRLYRQEAGGKPVAITAEPPTPGAHRFADLRLTPDGAHLVAVRERHEGGEVTNEIVSLAADGSAEPRVLAGGNDFYSNPRPSPDGRLLAWLTWNHPNMPWDGTELWVADLGPDGTVAGARLVAGGPAESIAQPEWSPSGRLHFVSDRTGWWNLYREAGGGRGAEALLPMEAEFAGPQWMFDPRTYAFVDEDRIACLFSSDGVDRLGLLRPSDRVFRVLDVPFTSHHASCLDADGGRLWFVAASPTEADAVIELDPDGGSWTVLRQSLSWDVDPAAISVAEPVEFPTAGGRTAHALFYPPTSATFEGPLDERPPLLVKSHGGPTSHVTSALDPAIQFWTSRGIGVVDVNYGGSTGYGREYRERLKGRWGIVDLDDCVAAARYLAERGDADRDRLLIRGGSAGGYTTLCALTFRDDFAAGASYYGVADLEGLATDTHKFESRYLDGLIGPYPEAIETYHERSALRHAERISTPVILFQGLEDEVVPPSQSERMVAALRDNGVPHAYLAFEGEQHGFRRAETIARCLEAELSFYGQILGFTPAGGAGPVEIRSLPA